MDASGGGGMLSSLSSIPESRRPVTAQERQREREEKRRKRQERARERERKMKEKERREGKQGDSLGGVLLSDNDKSLLQRWTKMMDSRNEKSQISSNEGVKIKDCNATSHRGVSIGDNPQAALNNNTDKEVRVQPHEQLISQVKPNQPSLFQPPSTQQPSLLFSMSQRKPPADIVVAVSGGIDIMTVTGGFVKNNTLKPHNESNGQSGFNCLGNWSGQQLETRPPQQPQQNRKQQPLQSSFLQPQLQSSSQTQPEPQPQSQLLPLESFLTKAQTLARETNGNVNISGQNNLNSHSTATSGPMEKLCPAAGEKSGPQTTNPLCGALGVPSQPHPSLGFTDTGQQVPSIAPDIHTVTLQLSKSQVCVRFPLLCCDLV